ncbi:UNVERIFIED_CONTAM: hypothetical protein K2H54_051780 [Gekko kuhli]
MASKVKAEGPGLYNGVEIGKPTYFTVTVNDTSAGGAKLDVQFSGPGKGDVVRDSEVIHHHDNTYLASMRQRGDENRVDWCVSGCFGWL